MGASMMRLWVKCLVNLLQWLAKVVPRNGIDGWLWLVDMG